MMKMRSLLIGAAATGIAVGLYLKYSKQNDQPDENPSAFGDEVEYQTTIHMDSPALNDEIKTLTMAIFQDWKRLKDISVTRLSGGLTNALYKVDYLNSPVSALVRVFGKGSELIIDRKKELQVMRSLKPNAPHIYATFRNGIVYEYYPGRVLNVEDMRSGEYCQFIAKELCNLHKQRSEVLNEKEDCFYILQRWMRRIPAQYTDPKKQQRFTELNFNSIKTLIAEVELEMKNYQSPIVCSHNDLLNGNIILTDKEIKFIDFEYLSYNHRGFDFGNHFNEFAGFEMPLDHTKFPPKDLQYRYFQEYLENFLGRKPTQQELDDLYEETQKFSVVSHLFWGVWALLQASISNIDFDYMQYASDRFRGAIEKRQKCIREFSKK